MVFKSEISFVKSLSEKKYRKESQCFVVEGDKMVKEALASNFTIKDFYSTEEWAEKNHERIKKIDKLHIISPDELSRMSHQKTPNQALAVLKMARQDFDFSGLHKDLVVALDHIQDPGNLGTIVRTCDWFGIKNLICSTDTTDIFNPKTIQSTMGAIFRVKVVYHPLETILKFCIENSLPVYGAVLNGENMYKQNLENKGLLIMGNESSGINREILKNISQPLTIPGPPDGSGEMESLNVGIATAVICSEFRRQKSLSAVPTVSLKATPLI